MSIKPASILFAIISLMGCSFDKNKDDEMHQFNGIVVFQNFEGGFYGIVTDSGENLYPINDIPEDFRIDNLKVSGKYRPAKDWVTSYMWGKNVNLIEISLKSAGG